MTDDLVKRLREPIEFMTDHQIRKQREEAANKIERLTRIIANIYVRLHGTRNINERALEAVNIARAALGEKLTPTKTPLMELIEKKMNDGEPPVDWSK